MIQGTWFNAALLHKGVQIGRFEADHATHLVCVDLPFVDEPVERPYRDADTFGGSRCAEPLCFRLSRVLLHRYTTFVVVFYDSAETNKRLDDYRGKHGMCCYPSLPFAALHSK